MRIIQKYSHPKCKKQKMNRRCQAHQPGAKVNSLSLWQIDMEKIVFNSTAKSKNRLIDYTIELCITSPFQCMPFENKNFFSSLCNSGCKNYNQKWSCPPHAPTFSAISSHWDRLYVLYMRMPMNAFSEVKNIYLRIKAANSMLKSRADKYMRTLSKNYGKYISTGSCRLCKPCKVQKGMPCAHPSLMAYSFEALGIDVEALVNEFFEHPLLWYKNGVLPEYTSVVCGLLTNEPLSLEKLRQEYYSIIYQ